MFNNPFPYSLDNKRYHTLNYYFKNKFGKKVFKVSLNADFTCPNIDGSKAYGGCIFCNSVGSGTFAGDPSDDLIKQFDTIRLRQHKKWPDALYLGYFQAYTNTYAPVETLKKYYETILSRENVVGLSIATRPDAISDEVLDYLFELNKRCELWIELGLQSSNDKVAKFLNRGHTFKEYEDMVVKLRRNNIKVCAHIMNGIPNETKEDMINTVKDIVRVGVDGIKIHMLHILKDTPLAKYYEYSNFHVLSREEFIDVVCEQLCYINKEVVIFRVTGDSAEEELIAPKWILKKNDVTNGIDKLMLKNNIVQGCKIE